MSSKTDGIFLFLIGAAGLIFYLSTIEDIAYLSILDILLIIGGIGLMAFGIYKIIGGKKSRG
jgi:hypothetical protein